MTTKRIVLRPVHPNVGIQAAYRKRLDALIAEMNDSILYWIGAAYKKTGIAQDESATAMLRRALRKVSKQWQDRFDEGADDLARWLAQKTKSYSDIALASILKDAGFAVEFKMTSAMNDAYQAVIGENVNLIKSIASEHLTQVETLVMQSVQTGRDLGTLSKELQARYGVTKRRAALIARDQNNKATATVTRVRQQGLGITTAIWKHSHAGKTPRPSHLKADGQEYEIAKGMFLDGKWVWPGTEINCRCVSRSVIPGLAVTSSTGTPLAVAESQRHLVPA